jgi:hypothetical protein
MNELIVCPQCNNQIQVKIPGVRRIARGLYVREKDGRFNTTIESAPEEIVADYTQATQLVQSAVFGVLVASVVVTASVAIAPTLDALGVRLVATIGDAAILAVGSALAGMTLAYGFLIHGDALRVRVARWAMEQKQSLADGRTRARRAAADAGVVRIETTERREDGNFSRHVGELPCDRARFVRWATAALSGESIAIGKWYGKDRPFGRIEYQKILEELTGYPDEMSPIVEKARGGYRVTESGLYLLRAILREFGTPLPRRMAAERGIGHA